LSLPQKRKIGGLNHLTESSMNARRSPQGIFRAHPPDQRAQFRIDFRAVSKRARFPTPVPTEAGSMPPHEGLGPDDRDRLEDRRKPSIQHDQEQAIPVRELDATAHPPLQHDHLMSECCVLCLKSALRLERQSEQGQPEADQRDHRRRGLGDSVRQSITDKVFGTHNSIAGQITPVLPENHIRAY